MRKLILFMSFMLGVLNMDAQRPHTQKKTTVQKSKTKQTDSKAQAKYSFVIVPPSGLLSGEERLKDSLIQVNSQLFKLINYQKETSHTVEDPNTHTKYSFIQAIQEENGIRVKAIVKSVRDVENVWSHVKIRFRGETIEESFDYQNPMLHTGWEFANAVYMYDMFFYTEKTTSMIEELSFVSSSNIGYINLSIKNLPVTYEGKSFVYDSEGKTIEMLKQENQWMMNELGFGRTKNLVDYDGISLKVEAYGIGRNVRLVVKMSNTTNNIKRIIFKKNDYSWCIASTGYPIVCVENPNTDNKNDYNRFSFNLQPGEKRTIFYEFKVFEGYDLPSLLQSVRFEEINYEREIVFRNIPIDWYHPVTGNIQLGMNFEDVQKQGYILQPSEPGNDKYRCAVLEYDGVTFEKSYLIFKDNKLTTVEFMSGVKDVGTASIDDMKIFNYEYPMFGPDMEYRDNVIKPTYAIFDNKFRTCFGKSRYSYSKKVWLNSNIEYELSDPGLFAVVLRITKK